MPGPRHALPLRLRCAAAALLLAAGAGGASPAHAEDRWSDPYPGVRYLYRTTATPNRIHVLVVDLDRPALRVRATRHGDRGRTVSSFASVYGCELAVNGDFFRSGFETHGIAVGDGARWPGSTDGDEESFIAFGGGETDIVAPWDIVAEVEPWVEQLVSGRELVTIDGRAADYVSGNTLVAPRTAAGLSRDGRTLYLAVVDGRSSASAGMTLYQLGQLMADVGAWQAINLDGGGSSAMFVEPESGIVNQPSDGSERTVANHLGVVVDPLPKLAARFVGQGSDAPEDPEGVAYYRVCAGSPVQFFFELENVGAASWGDWSDYDPGAWGRAVRLGVPEDTADPFVGTNRVSINESTNNDVHSVYASAPGGDCADAPRCSRTVFELEGTAPETPGTYRTTWRLVDELRAWFGPEMWLSYRVVSCPSTDAGVPRSDGGITMPGPHDGGRTDGAASVDGSPPDHDGGRGGDADPRGEPTATSGGCGCTAASNSTTSTATWMLLWLLLRRRGWRLTRRRAACPRKDPDWRRPLF